MFSKMVVEHGSDPLRIKFTRVAPADHNFQSALNTAMKIKMKKYSLFQTHKHYRETAVQKLNLNILMLFPPLAKFSMKYPAFWSFYAVSCEVRLLKTNKQIHKLKNIRLLVISCVINFAKGHVLEIG